MKTNSSLQRPAVNRLISVALALFFSLALPAMVVRVLAQDAPPEPPALPQPPTLPVGPAVWTDLADYPPGATATIRGTGFAPGETVTLQVLHADGTPSDGADHEPWSAIANVDGVLETTWHVCEDDCLGSLLMLTAVGASSGAQASSQFTDGVPLAPGTPLAWGYGDHGQLGDGVFLTSPPYGSSAAVAVSGLNAVTAVAGGGYHSLALKSDGTVRAWGYGYYGQLGNGTFYTSYPYAVSTAVQIAGLSGVRAVSGGGFHSLALKSDGTVRAWGYGYYGQLGNGTFYTSDPYGVSTPVQVSGLSGVVAVAGGGYHSLALKSDGTVWAWGYDASGQLGNASFANSGTPVQVSGLSGVVAVAGGDEHSLALKSDGTVWAWGNGGNGQLGNASLANRTTPVQVSSLSGVVAVAGGGYHSLALKSDGTVWAWGSGGYGQLGNGSFAASSMPVQVSGLSGVVSVTGGGNHSLALKSDGTVWVWGYGYHGQLGNGTFYTSYPYGVSTPVQATSIGYKIKAIVAGSYHNLALPDDTNQPPTAEDDTYTLDEDTPLTIAAPGVLANDTDPDGDGLTVSAFGAPAHGTLSVNPNGSFTYTPAVNSNGPNSFTYTISDGKGGTASATVNLTITPVNDPPTAEDVHLSTPEDTPLSFTLTGSDPDGDPLTIFILTQPAHGQVSGAWPNFTYTPAPNFNGADQFDYQVNSVGFGQAAHVFITVTPVNDPPIANSDFFTIPEDAPLRVADVLTNDTDADGDPLIVVEVRVPSHGNFGDLSGVFAYFPTPNYFGPDSFRYIISDGHGATSTNFAYITVTAVNDAPVARCKSVTVPADANCSAHASINDGSYDVDVGDTITHTQTPPGPYPLGQTTVTLTVTDNHGASSQCTATVTVQDQTPPLITLNGANPITVECHASFTDPGATANDACAGNFAASASGTVDVNSPGTYTLTYTASDPSANAALPVTRTVNVVDTTPPVPEMASLPTATGQCSATVSAPTATDACDGPITGTTSDPLSYTAQGTYTVHWTYADSHGNKSTQTQMVTVQDTTPPFITCPADKVANADPLVCSTIVSGIGPVTAGDNCSGYSITYTLRGATTGSGANDASGTTFDLGTTTVTYTITDVSGLTTSCSFSVTVLNPSPVVTLTGPLTALYPINTPVNFTASFTDAGGGTHTGTWMFDSISQAATIVEPGGATPGLAAATYTFTAAGVYSVKLTINDSCGASGTADRIGEMNLLVVVYDPSAGFVTGGGWISSPAGAYVADPTLTGKANFGFVSKYQKGATLPTGNTEFQFKVANFNFHSTTYDWLVVAGAKAQYKGTGTVNGTGNFGFLLTGTDGQVNGGGGVDEFRIKVWNKTTGGVVYDNVASASDDLDNANPQALGGGNIAIQK